MDPSQPPRNSTRARKAHPPKKPSYEPIPRTTSKLVPGANRHRSKVKRIRGNRAGRLRVNPAPSPEAMAATELFGIRRKLELIQSCTQVVGFALGQQNCELDTDASRILNFHVADALMDQIERIDVLLGRRRTHEGVEEDRGAS